MKINILKTAALSAVSLTAACSLFAGGSNGSSADQGTNDTSYAAGANENKADQNNENNEPSSASSGASSSADENAVAPDTARADTGNQVNEERSGQNESQQHRWWQNASEKSENNNTANKWDYTVAWKDKTWTCKNEKSNAENGKWNSKDWMKSAWHSSPDYSNNDTGWQTDW